MPVRPAPLALLLLLACAACRSQAPLAAAKSQAIRPQPSDQVLQVDAVLLQVFETGDVALLDSIIAPDFVNHAGVGDRVGLAALKEMTRAFQTHAPGVKMAVKRRWADDTYASDWIEYTGPSLPAPIEGIELTRYANGKAVEHWFFPRSPTGR